MTQAYQPSEKPSVKRVLLVNTVDTMHEGYPVCYNRDTTTGDSAAAVDMNRAYQVEKPATANLKDFAGVIAKRSDGVVGKSAGIEVSIVEPTAAGRVCNVWADESCTILTTKLALTGSTWAFGAEAAAATTWATANQTIDRSDTAGKVQCILGNVETALVSATATAITGGTTGATTVLIGGTAGAPADILNLASRLAANIVDVAALATAMKKKGIMSKA